MKTMKSSVPRARRPLTVAVGIYAAVALLVACGDDGEDQSGGSTLTWATDAAWHKDGQDAVGAAAEDAIGIGIESTIFPTTDAFQADVRSAITTDTAFPLFDWWSGYRMQDLAEQDLLVDLSEQWDAAIDRGEYPADLKEMFSWDGRAYGLPKLVNYWGVIYNKALFEQHNLTVPTSWQELEAVCRTLSDNGVYPFGLVIQDTSWASFIWFEEVLVRTDPELYLGVLDGSVPYDDPRVVEAVGTWTDFMQQGYITPSALLNSDNYIQEFSNGAFAMQLIGDWASSSYEAAGLVGGEDYGFFVMPGITEAGDRSLIVEARPTVLAKASADVESATEFAEYFLSVDGATAWAETAKVNSPNLEVPDETRPQHLREIASAVADGQYDLYPRYWEGTPTPVVDAVYPLLGKIIEHPEDHVAILGEAQAAAEQAWPQE